MSLPSERNIALFIDFDNVAIGARDSRQRFDVKLLLQRVLEKGKVVVKRAYADWHFYREYMPPLHESAIELIEVPAPKISGKNSADIRLVVDAIDLCYSKTHIDTFVIVSGDSDFSPLVSKLRENDKHVLGIGVRASSSHLLIGNCDEFIFYDDIYNSAVSKLTEKVSSVPQDLRQLFDFLLQTTQSLLQESRGVLYSSLLKDTMKRKQPEFSEANYGYTTFGDLLEDARDRGLLEVERDNRAGGTLVILGLGKTEIGQELRNSRARRRRRDRSRGRNGQGQAGPSQAGLTKEADEVPARQIADGAAGAKPLAEADTAAEAGKRTSRRSGPEGVGERPGAGEVRVPKAATRPESAPSDEPRQNQAGARKPAGSMADKAAKKAAKKPAKKAAKKVGKTARKKAGKTAKDPAG